MYRPLLPDLFYKKALKTFVNLNFSKKKGLVGMSGDQFAFIIGLFTGGFIMWVYFKTTKKQGDG